MRHCSPVRVVFALLLGLSAGLTGCSRAPTETAAPEAVIDRLVRLSGVDELRQRNVQALLEDLARLDGPDPAADVGHVRSGGREGDEPPATPREELWRRITAARAARRRVIGLAPALRWGVGIAAVLALGVAIGRWSAGEAGSHAPATVAGTGRR